MDEHTATQDLRRYALRSRQAFDQHIDSTPVQERHAIPAMARAITPRDHAFTMIPLLSWGRSRSLVLLFNTDRGSSYELCQN